MQIKGSEVRKGHLWFFLTAIIGVMNGVHSFWLTRRGAPPSAIIHLVFVSNIVIVALAVIAPLVGAYILIKKIGASFMSRLYWLTMVVGVSLCLIVIVRGMTWLLLSEDKQKKDLNSFLYLREKKNEKESDLTIYYSRVHKCCGVIDLYDWEAIYTEVDAIKTDVRPRKLPDFCCKEPTYGCGTRYLTELFDGMEFIVSNCDDINKEFSIGCITVNDLLKPYTDGVPPKELPRNVTISGQKDAKFNGEYYLVNITDPRIDTAVDKLSILEQPAVQELCGLLPKVTFRIHVMTYYKGFVENVTSMYKVNGLKVVKDVIKPCFPKKVEDEKNNVVKSCSKQLVPVNYFTHAYGFCSWLKLRSKTNETRYSREDKRELAKVDGRLYWDGCFNHTKTMVDTYSITVEVYCAILLCLFCILMHHYHKYYFEYRSPMLQTMPMPRWYEPLPHEVPLMHSFGDVDFIVDGNCKQLPPIPCRLEEDLGLEDGSPNVTEGLTLKLDDDLKVDAEAAAEEQN